MNPTLHQAKQMLNEINIDEEIPKNIRDEIKKAIEMITNNTDDTSILKDKINAILDKVVNEPTLPFYARTQIWSVVSILESIETE